MMSYVDLVDIGKSNMCSCIELRYSNLRHYVGVPDTFKSSMCSHARMCRTKVLKFETLCWFS